MQIANQYREIVKFIDFADFRLRAHAAAAAVPKLSTPGDNPSAKAPTAFLLMLEQLRVLY